MFKTLTLSDHSIKWLAFALSMLLFAFEVYVVGVDHANYYLYLLDEESAVFIAIALAAILLSFVFVFRFAFIALSATWPYKVLCFLIFAISVTVEYGYQKALGRFTDKIDVETAIAATPDQQIASIMMYLSASAAIPAAVLLVAQIAIRSEKPKGSLHFVVAVMSFFVGFTAFPIVVDQKFPTFATAAFFRTTSDLFIYGPMTTGNISGGLARAKPPRRAVPKADLPPDHRPDRNIVIVIDESTMGSHFSLNGYARKTTSFLDKLEADGVLHNWGIAAAASTGSRFTYNALITGLGPDDFPDRSEIKVDTFPMVFQYAKAMGHKTYFFDGQMNGYWGANPDDLNYIDSWQGILDITAGMGFQTWEVDDLLAKRVRSVIESSTGNFIFVFKHGSHIPYHINYPPDQQVWTPSYESGGKFDIPSGDQLPAVVNAYDNSIRHNVNSFFQNLITDYSAIPNKTVVIYTGDHGQTLFANGRSSHGGNTKAEASVPLLIIGELETSVDTSYRASHGNIFPTVLDLIGYPPDKREVTRSPSLLRAKRTDSKQRFFNPDLGTKVPFD